MVSRVLHPIYTMIVNMYQRLYDLLTIPVNVIKGMN